MDGMTVFDLVHAKIVTNEIFMQTFSHPLTRKSSEKGRQLLLKSIVWCLGFSNFINHGKLCWQWAITQQQTDCSLLLSFKKQVIKLLGAWQSSS